MIPKERHPSFERIRPGWPLWHVTRDRPLGYREAKLEELGVDVRRWKRMAVLEAEFPLHEGAGRVELKLVARAVSDAHGL